MSPVDNDLSFGDGVVYLHPQQCVNNPHTEWLRHLYREPTRTRAMGDTSHRWPLADAAARTAVVKGALRVCIDLLAAAHHIDESIFAAASTRMRPASARARSRKNVLPWFV